MNDLLYKQIDGKWNLQFSDSLSFGHGLSSGMVNGQPIILAGNRRESFTLDSFLVRDLSRGIVDRNVIEEDAGPTQTQVLSFEGRDYLMSANQKKNEVALYTLDN